MIRRLLRIISRWLSRLNTTGMSHVGREIETSPPTPINPEVRFETNDIMWTHVLVAAAAITTTTVMLMVLLWAMLRWFSEFSNRVDYSVPGRTMETPRTIFEGVTTTELESIRAAENAHLQKYAWADREKDRVKIPIERAMEIVAQNGPPQFPAHHHSTDHNGKHEHAKDAQHSHEEHEHSH
jgi:hypothetical protein